MGVGADVAWGGGGMACSVSAGTAVGVASAITMVPDDRAA
jgi:hypothetical protein